MPKSLYNREYLIKICNENNIIYEDISKEEKINRNTIIKGNCKTNNCINTFIKTLRNLVEIAGPYCEKCSIERGKDKKKKTCLERFGTEYSLQSKEIKNKIKKKCLDKYGVEYASQSDQIKEKTKETNNIKYGGHPSKLDEIKEKINNTNNQKYGGHPTKTKEVQERKINTVREKYNVNNVSELETIKDKKKETCLINYGVENPSLSYEIKDKKKETCLINYGVEQPFQSIEIQEKIKDTCIQKYGFEYPSQNQDIQQKIKETCLDKYGVEYALQSNEVKVKSIETNLKKYGGHPTKTKEVQEKKIKTCIYKYGVNNVMHDPKIADMCSKNSYSKKDYILPSGKIIKIQGYEHYALDELVINYDEEDIINGEQNVPEIWYNDEENNKHRHYVDIFISSKKLCIEVKSTWTADKKKDNIFLKQDAAKKLGYKYQIWVYDGKGKKVNCFI